MNKRGFTLVEMIMVMALMAIMLAVAAPSFFSWQEGAQYKEVAREVLSSLRNARSLAITNNQDIFTEVDIDNHQMKYNGITKNLSDRVSLETKVNSGDGWSTGNGSDTSKRAVTFHPNGSCQNAFYVRVNADDDLIVSIESTSSGLARLP